MNNEVYDALEEARMKLGEAVDAVRQLSQVCERNQAGEGGSAHRRINAYLLPHLQAWLDDEGQIGSFPRLWDELKVDYCPECGDPVEWCQGEHGQEK